MEDQNQRPSLSDRLYISFLWAYNNLRAVGTISVFIIFTICFTIYFFKSSNSSYVEKTEKAQLLITEMSRIDPVFESTSDEKRLSNFEMIGKLSNIVSQDKRLEPYFGSTLAQELIWQGQIPEQYLVDSSLNRLIEEKLDIYAEFSRISLVANEKKYQEALQMLQILKKQVEQSKEDQQAVYMALLLEEIALNKKCNNNGQVMTILTQVKGMLQEMKQKEILDSELEAVFFEHTHSLLDDLDHSI